MLDVLIEAREWCAHKQVGTGLIAYSGRSVQSRITFNPVVIYVGILTGRSVALLQSCGQPSAIICTNKRKMYAYIIKQSAADF